MEKSEPVFIFLSGLGADSRLYKNQTAAFSNSIAVDWIDPNPNEKLEDYAIRLADSIPKPDTPIIVCGLSLGGMIAPYFAQHLGAEQCILLCSIRNAAEFPRRYYFAWRLIRFCPPIHWLVLFFAKFFVRRKLIPYRIRPEICEQYLATKISRLDDLTRMMLEWAYDSGNKKNFRTEIPVLQVHGNLDKLLPIKLTKPDIVIEDGGHLLPLSHPDQINEILLYVQKNFPIYRSR